MRNLQQQLCAYAAYHRCRRNLAAHFVGIPLIVLGAATLLSRPSFPAGPVAFSPATAIVASVVIFYFWLDLRFGVALAALMGASALFGAAIAREATGIWLTVGGVLFGVGWAVQLVGHRWEGRKPAFVDDLIGLLIGPLFLVAEVAFALGLRRELQRAIDSQAGTMRR